MSSAVKSRLTAEEYLEIERRAESRHEFYDGEMFAMAGASPAHTTIAGNVFAEARQRLRGTTCRAYVIDMRVLVDATGLYTYPDVVIACGQPKFLDQDSATLLNPVVIVEVLSQSTEAYDRGTKFEQYRQLKSLREYVLISQNKVLVERYTRQGNQWVLTELKGADDHLVLDSVQCEIPIRAIYEMTDLAGEWAGE